MIGHGAAQEATGSMEMRFSWDSPSARQVLTAVLDSLAEHGYDSLTGEELRLRAGPAARALGDPLDVEALLVAALEHVHVFAPVEPTGCLRDDLRALLAGWRGGLSRDERVITAVLSAAEWHPRLREAVHDALDRPLAQALGSLLSRVATHDDIPPRRLLTLNWVLRGLVLDRLRSGPRTAVDLDALVDFLVAGVQAAESEGHPDASRWTQ